MFKIISFSKEFERMLLNLNPTCQHMPKSHLNVKAADLIISVKARGLQLRKV